MSILLTAELDTIYKIVSAKGTLLVVQVHEPIFSTADILSMVSILCSVGIFWWQLHKSRKKNQDNLRSTWFLQVIVQPNLVKISDFYDKVISDTDNDVNTLSQKYNTGGSARDISIDLAKYKRTLKDEVKTLLGGFQCLLKACEPNVADDIDAVLDALVDVVTTAIDGYETHQEGQTCKVEVLNNKQLFISKIYSAWNK